LSIFAGTGQAKTERCPHAIFDIFYARYVENRSELYVIWQPSTAELYQKEHLTVSLIKSEHIFTTEGYAVILTLITQMALLYSTCNSTENYGCRCLTPLSPHRY